ncbi:Uncharacterized protein FWK35_00034182 [Aphis craccivora]|uniref:Ig-like domain-containing protein n=1 Tax=Aphis craccivora TaxID=307492 RepID=A0A6G0VZQ2_APHCR|nr:Uncharacterized protein FWK35_00034182 [Aphis craccivora]
MLSIGIYCCDEITGINNKISYHTQLLVGNQPFIYENYLRSLIVVEPQSVQLACFAGGYRTPRIFWRKPNRVTFSKFLQLKKKIVELYYCIAENGIGRRISIAVEFPPILTALQTSVGQVVNYDAYLLCRI